MFRAVVIMSIMGLSTIAALGQQAVPDVAVTNAIPPGNRPACGLSDMTAEAAKAIASPEDLQKATGCTVRKLSSFQLLGSTTEIYEVQDGQRRLQLTLRDRKVVSHTFRNL